MIFIQQFIIIFITPPYSSFSNPYGQCHTCYKLHTEEVDSKPLASEHFFLNDLFIVPGVCDKNT